MRELSLSEIDVVSGAGPAVDTLNSTITGGGAGYATGMAIASSTARGAAWGSRAGLYGAAAGAVIGFAAGVYDWATSSKDGSDYNQK